MPVNYCKQSGSKLTADVATALPKTYLFQSVHYFVEQKKRTKLWVALKVFLPASGTVFSKRYILLIFHCFKMCVWKVQLKLSLLCKSHKSIWTFVVLEGIHRHFSKFSLLKVYAYFVLQLDVEVVSCTPSTLKIAGSKPIKGFDVIFTDTVLFPEGGGQVCTYTHYFYKQWSI